MRFPRTKSYLVAVLSTSAVLYGIYRDSERITSVLLSWPILTLLFVAYLLDRIAQVPDEPVDTEPPPPNLKS